MKRWISRWPLAPDGVWPCPAINTRIHGIWLVLFMMDYDIYLRKIQWCASGNWMTLDLKEWSIHLFWKDISRPMFVFWILYSEVDPCISICPVFALHGGVKFLLYPICCQDVLDIQIMLVPHDGLFILKSKPSNPFVVQDDSGTEKSSQTIWQGSIEGPPRKTRRCRNPPGFPGVLWYLYFGHPMIWMLQYNFKNDVVCASLLRIASVFKDIVPYSTYLLPSLLLMIHHHL